MVVQTVVAGTVLKQTYQAQCYWVNKLRKKCLIHLPVGNTKSFYICRQHRQAEVKAVPMTLHIYKCKEKMYKS